MRSPGRNIHQSPGFKLLQKEKILLNQAQARLKAFRDRKNQPKTPQREISSPNPSRKILTDLQELASPPKTPANFQQTVEEDGHALSLSSLESSLSSVAFDPDVQPSDNDDARSTLSLGQNTLSALYKDDDLFRNYTEQEHHRGRGQADTASFSDSLAPKVHGSEPNDISNLPAQRDTKTKGDDVKHPTDRRDIDLLHKASSSSTMFGNSRSSLRTVMEDFKTQEAENKRLRRELKKLRGHELGRSKYDKDEISRLKQELSTARYQTRDAVRELESTRREHQEAWKEAQKRASDIKAAQERQNQHCQQQVAALRSQLKAQMEAAKQGERAQTQVVQLRSQLEHHEEQAQKTLEAHTKLSTLHLQLAEASEQRDTIALENSSLREETVRRIAELQGMREKHAGAEQQLMEAFKREETLRAEVQQLRDALTSARLELREAKTALSRAEASQLEDSVALSKKAHSLELEYQEKTAKWQAKHSELFALHQTLQQEHQQSLDQVANLQKDQQELIDDKKRLGNSLAEQTLLAREVKDKLTATSRRLDEVSHSRDSLLESLNRQTQLVQDLEQQVADLEQRNKQYEDELDTLRAKQLREHAQQDRDHENLADKVVQLTSLASKLQVSIDQSKETQRASDSIIERLSKEKALLKRRLDENNNGIDRATILKLVEQVKTLKQEHHDLRQNTSNSISAFFSDVKNSIDWDQPAKAEESRTAKESEDRDLHMELEAAKDQLEIAKQENQSLVVQLGSAQTQNFGLRLQLQKLRAKTSDGQVLRQIRPQLVLLMDQVRELQQDNDELRDEVASSTEEFSLALSNAHQALITVASALPESYKTAFKSSRVPSVLLNAGLDPSTDEAVGETAVVSASSKAPMDIPSLQQRVMVLEMALRLAHTRFQETNSALVALHSTHAQQKGEWEAQSKSWQQQLAMVQSVQKLSNQEWGRRYEALKSELAEVRENWKNRWLEKQNEHNQEIDKWREMEAQWNVRWETRNQEMATRESKIKTSIAKMWPQYADSMMLQLVNAFKSKTDKMEQKLAMVVSRLEQLKSVAQRDRVQQQRIHTLSRAMDTLRDELEEASTQSSHEIHTLRLELADRQRKLEDATAALDRMNGADTRIHELQGENIGLNRDIASYKVQLQSQAQKLQSVQKALQSEQEMREATMAELESTIERVRALEQQSRIQTPKDHMNQMLVKQLQEELERSRKSHAQVLDQMERKMTAEVAKTDELREELQARSKASADSKSVAAKLRKAENRLEATNTRLTEAQRFNSDLKQQLAEAKSREKSLEAALSSKAGKEEELERLLRDRSQKLDQCMQELKSTQDTLEGCQKQISVSVNHQRRAGALQKEAQELRSKLALVNEASTLGASQQQKTIRKLQQECLQLRSLLQEAQDEGERALDLQEAALALEQENRQLKEQEEKLCSDIDSLRSQLASSDERAQALLAQARSHQQWKDAAGQQNREFEKALKAAEVQVASAQERVEELLQQLSESKLECQRTKVHHDQATSELIATKADLDKMSRRVDALKQELSNSERQTEELERTLLAEKKRFANLLAMRRFVRQPNPDSSIGPATPTSPVSTKSSLLNTSAISEGDSLEYSTTDVDTSVASVESLTRIQHTPSPVKKSRVPPPDGVNDNNVTANIFSLDFSEVDKSLARISSMFEESEGGRRTSQ